MGIKCSLLGHRFGESELQKEREEQGSEVLTTIKEIETCQRCGKERIVSESKEVTSLETADESAEGDAEPPTEPTTATTPSPTPDMTAAEDDAELIDEAETDTATPEPPEPAAPSEPDGSTVSAADDDGVILEDEEQDRDPGEWPDEEETSAEPDEPETTDDTTAETSDDTGEWPDEYDTDESTATAPDVEWPEETQAGGTDWEPAESLTQRIDQTEVEPVGSAAITVPEGTFECPECGFRTSVEETSLREGDFCPDCHRGALEQRAEDETRKE